MKKLMLKLVLMFGAAVVVCAPAVRAQSSQRLSVVQNAMGEAIPSAGIYVCTNTATVTLTATPPCTPEVSIFQDAALSIPITQPALSSGNGNYSYYVSPQLVTECVTGVQVNTFCQQVQLNNGGSSSGGSPAGPAGTIQSTTGSAFTTSILSQSPGTLGTPGAVTMENAGSFAIKGPRPYLDVTTYGAVGDSETDDTAAINAAMAAACAYTINGQHVYPEIRFPPGYYVFNQPQLPSTSPVFEVPCQYLTFRGMGTAGPTAFARMPEVILQAIPGASPNGAPMFDARFPTVGASITFKDMYIAGYNKALWFYKTVQAKLENVTLSVQNTGMADNSALMLTNLFWFEWNGGTCNEPEVTGTYCILATGDVVLGGENPLVGLLHIHDLQGTGNFFHYSQRINGTGGLPGSWEFDNIRGFEANQGPNGFIYISNDTGNPPLSGLPLIAGIKLGNVTSADSISSNPPLIEVTQGTALSGVEIENSTGANAGGAAIQLDGTIAQGSQVIACTILSAGMDFAWQVVDNNGNPMPGCSVQNGPGFDFFPPDQLNSGNLRFASDVNRNGNNNGPAIRLTYGNGSNRFAGIALDPQFGVMFNTGTDFGYGAAIAQQTRGDLDFYFPAAYAPTNLSGTATTGGSLSAGTYYGTVYACTSLSCNSTESAPSIQSAGVVVGGSNNAITWSWTLPLQGASSVVAYAVAVSTTPNFNNKLWNPAQTNIQVVTGGTATSLTMNSLPSSGGQNTTVNTFAAVHRMTENALGLNTLSPNANSLTVNGGIGCAHTTVSSGRALTSADCWLDVTGTTTMTAPHALLFSKITVFNAGTNTVTLAIDSGLLNGSSSSLTFAPNQGADVSCNGTNCSAAQFGGTSSAGANQALSNLTSATAVNQSLIPGTVNNVDLGTSTLPWRNAYIGVAANKSVELDASLLTTNRDQKFPDESGTFMMNADLATCGQIPALTGDTTTAGSTCATVTGKVNGQPFALSNPKQNQLIGWNGADFVNAFPAQGTDQQTGTGITIGGDASTIDDRGLVVERSNAGTMNDTLPQAGSANYGGGFFFVYDNENATGGASAVLTTTTSVFKNLPGTPTTITVVPKQRAYIFTDPDGTDWDVFFAVQNAGCTFIGDGVFDTTTPSGSCTATALTQPVGAMFVASSNNAVPATGASAIAPTAQVAPEPLFTNDPRSWATFYDEFSCASVVASIAGCQQWNVNGTGGTASVYTGSGNGPYFGAEKCATAATASDQCNLFTTAFQFGQLNLANVTKGDIFIRVLLGSTTNINFFGGFTDSNSGKGEAAPEYVGIAYNVGKGDSSWMCVVSGGTATRTAISGTLDATTFHTFRIRWTGAKTVSCSEDGGTETAMASTNFPTDTNEGPQFEVDNNATANIAFFAVDYFIAELGGVSR
jgi:hypothetical protein